MSLYVLDTDILTLFQHGHPKVTHEVQTRSPNDLAITAITVDEQISGWYSMLRQAKAPDEIARAYANLLRSVQFLATWQMLNYSENAVAGFQRLKSMKLGVKAQDLRIAAVVIENSGILVTRSLSDFHRVPGIALEDWTV